jgi:PAS domain S-box-containing protein
VDTATLVLEGQTMRPHAVNLLASRRAAARTVLVALGALLAVAFVALALRDRAPNAYHPHGYCYLWDPTLVGLLVTSDTAIWLSYMAIGVTLVWLVRRAGRAIPFRWMFVAFGAFIASCGATHLMDVVTLYTTAFWLAAAIKGVTAVASVATAVALPPLVPRVLHLLDDARVSATRRQDLEQLARTAAAGEAKFRTLLESTPDAIVTVAGDGRILLVNSEAEALFGYTRAEMVGQPVEMLLPEPLRQAHEAHRRDFHANPRRRPMGVGLDLVALRKDGSTFPTEVSLSPFRRDRDQGAAVIVVVRDITERRKAEDARARLLHEQAARAEAEAASRAKDELLAVVSHELRTPLNAITGWTSLLRSKSLDAATTARALEVIDRNAQAQRQVVEDLLDVSSVMAGKIRLEKKDVDLRHVLEAALDSARPAAEAKDLNVQVSLDPSLPRLSADPNRLQQIFWNLLSNAIKFTAPGGAIRLAAGRGNSHVRIQVADTGIGIGSSFLPHVFERFRQRDSSTTRAYGGLGLGLALVRELVELHGGRVSADSAGEGQGAVFTVELPVSPAPAAPIPGTTGDDREQIDLGGVRVLFVDDEVDSRELASAVLGGSGAEVVTAASGGEALGELSHTVPDVLISDIAMPDVDGYQLMRAVRERRLQVPAIALTALGRDQDRDEALAAGYELYLTKPVQPAELVAAVARFVGAHRRRV